MKTSSWIKITIACGVLLITGLACGFCPPPGPWPQPPSCGGAATGQTARNDMGCFPPSCDLLPAGPPRIMCQQFKSGQDVWDWPRDCTQLPTKACSNLCSSEVQRYIDTGHKNWEAGIKNNTDWWKEPYTKVYTFGSVNQHLEIFQPDAHPWGAAPNEDDLLKIEIAYSHYYNMPFAGNNFYNFLESIDPETGFHSVAYKPEQVPQELQSAVLRTLEGEVAHEALNPDQKDTKSGILFNGFNPAFLETNLKEWKHLVDFEADGVMIDNLRGIPKIPDLANYFDDYTITEFDKYLQQNLTEKDWQKIGAKADNFNYAEFLRSKGYTSASFLVQDESWRQIPLVNEFRSFIAQKNAEAFCSMSDQIHAYAKEQGRQVTVSANMGGRDTTVPQEGCADYVTAEFVYIGSGKPYTYHTVVPWAKFSLAKDKSLLNVIHLSDYLPLNELIPTDPELYVDIYRLGILESYAARSSQIHLRPDGQLASYANDLNASYALRSDTSRLEKIKPAFDFMRRYKPYFANFNTSNAKVALLFSNNLAYQFQLQDPATRYYLDDLQLGSGLYRLGVDYDVIDPATPLDKYAVVVLPRAPSLTDADAQTLLDFVKAGGKLVILNQPADGGSLLHAGKQGNGEIVKFNPGDNADFAPVTAYIKEITGVIQSDSTPPLSAISYTDGNGNYVVHLMSSVTDLSKDFPLLENIHLTLPFPIAGMKVSYASLENPDLVPLDAANIVIPNLKTYGMLVIEKP